MDVAALTALIQQGALGEETEVSSDGLTGGEWKRLAGLELYRALSPSAPASSVGRNGLRSRWSLRGRTRRSDVPKELSGLNGAAASPLVTDQKPSDLTETYDLNLSTYFESLEVKRLAVDSWFALLSVVLSALFSVTAHRSVLPLLLSVAAWAGAYFYVDRNSFPAWIRGIRFSGFRRFPWNPRIFQIVAVGVPGYFLAASFMPPMPREGLFRLLDCFVCLAFTSAAATIWAFHTNTRRMKRAFLLSISSNQASSGPVRT